jgi:hypothetical protein
MKVLVLLLQLSDSRPTRHRIWWCTWLFKELLQTFSWEAFYRLDIWSFLQHTSIDHLFADQRTPQSCLEFWFKQLLFKSVHFFFDIGDIFSRTSWIEAWQRLRKPTPCWRLHRIHQRQRLLISSPIKNSYWESLAIYPVTNVMPEIVQVGDQRSPRSP